VPLCWAGRDSCCLEACLLSQCEVSECGKSGAAPGNLLCFLAFALFFNFGELAFIASSTGLQI
jgi:hypothetical protein